MNQTSTLPHAYLPVPHDEDRQGVFLDLEGVSGIGKSTLARLLATRLKATSLHTLPEPHGTWSRDPRLRSLPQLALYISGLLHASDRARQALTVGPVIADRYTPSVIACQAAAHGADPADVARLLEPFRPYLLAPDHTFYLVAEEDTLRDRIKGKADVKQDDADLFGVPGRFKQLRENFEAVAATDPTAVVLVTDGLTADQLADAIVAHVGGPRA
ncbi:thymidylate kinase [Streptomyces sp. NPDC048606]|uniref:dTMP kinase n=1 Tax=Streptomyces sp. NPDC048606 TaxID=3154726 RepID=UPI0034467951